MNSIQDFINFFKELPPIIKLMWTLAVFSFLILVELTIHLKLLRKRLRKHETSLLKYQKEYEELLVNYLYASEDKEQFSDVQKKINSSIQLGLSSNYKRKIFIKVMIKLMNEISGEMIDELKGLYRELGLIKYAKLKLRHKKWHVIAIGIRDLRRFKIEEVADEVGELINHSKEEVRREAHLYFLNVFNFKGLEFLSKLKASLSEWDQIGFFSVLQKFDEQEIPDLTRWLLSENDYVVLFTLNLVKIYNRMETKETLLELLNHENCEIRCKVIELLDYFYVVEAKPILLKIYLELTEKEKFRVFEFLENMGEVEDEYFIFNHIETASFNAKVIGLRILKKMNTSKFISLKERTDDEEIHTIINFIENN
ncbi:hypothetical protein KCTC32516_01553 [Polaribacter huanghezhanensis]|uniref:hypothetical protein n=1 Tax=Polaribacter huanghezhanensis TaxID=1354726 RepID=UPI002649400E|nr:hypothetical protein [Polaribacter huanghezhanensis]WKD86192.1 hypothetical protein KCTC32516_01553 [Polaribacter huanghezhanensis]